MQKVNNKDLRHNSYNCESNRDESQQQQIRQCIKGKQKLCCYCLGCKIMSEITVINTIQATNCILLELFKQTEVKRKF